MALDFPTSPTVGQRFISGAAQFVWDGTVWHTSNDTAYPFNLLINGQQDVVQVAGAINTYVADGWQITSNIATCAGQAWTGARVTPNKSYALYTTLSTLKPVLAAGDIWQIYQPMEGFRIAPLAWGTADAKPAVARFWVLFYETGTYTFRITNVAGTRSFMAHFVAPASTLTEIVIPIPPEPTGVWAKDNTYAGYFCFSIAVGSTNTGGSPGIWNTSAWASLPGSTNGANLSSPSVEHFYIGDIGLYVDPRNTGKPPPWEPVPYQGALLDSMRYWYKAQGGRGVGVGGAASARVMTPNMVAMRAAGALSVVGAVTIYDQAVIPAATMGTVYANVMTTEADMGTGATTMALARANIAICEINGTIYTANNAR